MSKLFERKETGIIITSIISFIVILLIIVKVPSTEEVNAEGLPEGAIQTESLLVSGAVQNTITYANGKTYSYMCGNTVTPIVTTKQMTDWILRKGNELIAILQELAFPFCVITFIIATFITLFGCLSGNSGQGLLGMSASALGYAAILYAPTLINVIVIFVSN